MTFCNYCTVHCTVPHTVISNSEKLTHPIAHDSEVFSVKALVSICIPNFIWPKKQSFILDLLWLIYKSLVFHFFSLFFLNFLWPFSIVNWPGVFSKKRHSFYSKFSRTIFKTTFFSLCLQYLLDFSSSLPL